MMAIAWSEVVSALTEDSVGRAVEAIAVRWDAPTSSRELLHHWARSMRQWVLSGGVERLPTRLRYLKEQHRWLHSELTTALIDGGITDEALICRRAFVGYLIDVLEPLFALERFAAA